MSLKETIKSRVKTAFKIAGDIVVPTKYYAKNIGTYDKSSGKKVDSISIYNIDAIFDGFAENEVNITSDIRFGDVKVMFINEEEFSPKTSDYIDYNNDQYEVVGVNTDPVRAVWTIQARKK